MEIEDICNAHWNYRPFDNIYVEFIDEYGINNFSRDLTKYLVAEYPEDDWRLDYADIMSIYHALKLKRK